MTTHAMTTLRTVVVSGVRHAGEYIPVLLARDDIDVLGVCEPPGGPEWAPEATATLAEKHGIPLLDWNDLPDADIAVVTSEPTRHASLAADCCRRDLDVVVDKPVAATIAEAESLAQVATETRRQVVVMSRCGTPAMQRARRAIDEGRIGMPVHVDFELLSSSALFAQTVERPELILDPRWAGSVDGIAGGEIVNFFGYAVDAVRYLTGLEVESIFCEAEMLTSAMHRAADVPDLCVASMQLTNGATATATIGRLPWAPSPQPAAVNARVLGSHGDLQIDDASPNVSAWRNGWSAIPIGRPGAVETFGWTLDNLRAARAGRAPSYSLADAVEAVRATTAAVRSATSGRVELVR